MVLSVIGETVKQGLIQLVLVISLFSNPMVGLAVVVADTSDQSGSIMLHHGQNQVLEQSNADNHDAQSEDDCPMVDCPMNSGDGNDCDLNDSCQPCLSLQFVNAMLFEPCDLEFSQPFQKDSTFVSTSIPSPPCLPELQPPDSSYLS